MALDHERHRLRPGFLPQHRARHPLRAFRNRPHRRRFLPLRRDGLRRINRFPKQPCRTLPGPPHASKTTSNCRVSFVTRQFFAVYFGKNKIVTIFAHLKTRCGGNRGPGGGIGRHATLRGWWALARVSSSLVLGTTNRFRIISKRFYFPDRDCILHDRLGRYAPQAPLREENAGKVQNYKRSRRPRISDRRFDLSRNDI